MPTLGSGVTLTPSSVPSARVANMDWDTSRSWKARIWSWASLSEDRNCSSTMDGAASSSSSGTRKAVGQLPSNFSQ